MVIAQSPLNVKESERFRGAGPEEAARMRLEIMAEKKVIDSTLPGGASQREMKRSSGMVRKLPVEEILPAVQTKKTSYASYCEPTHN